MKILTLAANPTTTTPLALDREIRAIHEKIRAASHRDSIKLVSRWAVRPDDLQQALLEEKPTIVHFSGHGSTAEQIVLVHSDGSAKPVAKKALISLFRTIGNHVRAVVLNACHSESQASALIEVVDCAIGMRRAIGDEAAIVFAAAFYRGIAFGQSMKVAFDLGVNALELEGVPEEMTPQLLMRTGVVAEGLVLAEHRSAAGSSRTPRPVLLGNELSPGGEVGEVIFCFMSWSQPCQEMLPLMDSLSQEPSLGIKVTLLDAERDNHRIFDEINISIYPTTFFVKNGYVLKRVTGKMSEKQFSEALSAYLGAVFVYR